MAVIPDVRCWWHGVVKHDRNRALRGVVLGDDMKGGEGWYDRWFAALSAAVPRVVSERADHLQEAKETTSVGDRGRLLLFEPEMTMSDGLAEAESDGLFDVHNCPAADFWLGIARVNDGAKFGNPYVTQVLVSWIPDELVPVAAKGVEVNPEACIEWLDDHPWCKSELGQRLLH